MKFCSHCRADVVVAIPEGDNRERYICSACELIFYENPRIIAGSIPVFDDRILICKRSIEPRLGYWTLPAGFMENGETTLQGAWRETYEESLAKVEIGALFSICNVPRINQVHMFYLAQMTNDHFGPTPESSEVKLVSADQIPWDDIAFATVKQTLKRFLADRDANQFRLHHLEF
ncbi:MAG: NUDIX hydrolase [Gammaproteobacteria bacterium]|mgnify:CR=1 FL=1|jgi:ADP-ribose pyrophosphatase YjhB (NUDIX family)|nr:NUDIX hydrolase [Gammaproteobacteria bacterium]MCP4879738.1 NUDIX hydrolase [Gammaproteobacteria bacterium]MDP6164976.1 NUDIX hydrolase [Gammaproteobacteria bacterium]